MDGVSGIPSKLPQAELDRITDDLVAAFKLVFDPEIPVNIYELGLIYDVIVDASNAVGIRMTLTAPACPAAQSLPAVVVDSADEIQCHAPDGELGGGVGHRA